MNVGNPETAFSFGQLPNEGIGLARLEFAAQLNKMQARLQAQRPTARMTC